MNVAVVIPCLNEVDSIGEVLDGLRVQTFKSFEVILVDGMSTDGTLEMVEKYIEAGHLNIKIIPNVKVSTPSALNLGVGNTSADVIIRLDAHARVNKDYVEQMLAHFAGGFLDVAGPQIKYFPGRKGSQVAELISEFTNSRLGNGGTPSRNRLNRPVRTEHTVMSCYRREVWEYIGGYDESLLSNEDFDFDYRAHRSGFRVFSLPEPTYFAKARPNLRSFISQRLRYGYWKSAVAKKNPDSLKTRQVAPVAFTLALILSPLFPPLFLFIMGLYTVVILYFSRGTISRIAAKYGTSRASVSLNLLSVALVTHCCWSVGFLCGMLQPRRRDA